MRGAQGVERRRRCRPATRRAALAAELAALSTDRSDGEPPPPRRRSAEVGRGGEGGAQGQARGVGLGLGAAARRRGRRPRRTRPTGTRSGMRSEALPVS
ncbi:MAG: hypothetical protein MZW92_15630 [Comamonadaceae bacterium]|nr:hypothetical protein [Comamonadaceae bacterium]